MSSRGLTIVVPTYRRGEVLLETLKHLFALSPQASEVIVVDQTEEHSIQVSCALKAWQAAGWIRWLRLRAPSIPGAMNRGLLEASHQLVLFLDDDIIPDSRLVWMHEGALERTGAALVAGRVIQPWHVGKESSDEVGFHFASTQAEWISDFMGGNFLVRRDIALRLGGFDERFVRVAYNFEAEFAYRLRCAGHRIYYEPAAFIHHLKVSSGGTRRFGDHLKSYRPSHAVGGYYFILRTWSGWQSAFHFLGRPLRAVATRHHLCRPWWIPATLVAELSGMGWALLLAAQGPRYVTADTQSKGEVTRCLG
jgi:GT2 family glycosyltransferase